jgi:hypothetical protein
MQRSRGAVLHPPRVVSGFLDLAVVRETASLGGQTPDIVYFHRLRQPDMNPAELHLKNKFFCPVSRSHR